jgi:quercetin dioxygenase-like cupin family protein
MENAMSFYDLNAMKPETSQDLGLQNIRINDGRINVVRLEIKRGAFTPSHCHEAECVVVVLQGALRFHMPRGAVTLTENQMLRIPGGDEHLSEALADTVALNISGAPSETGCGPFRNYDPDQYLWGV